MYVCMYEYYLVCCNGDDKKKRCSSSIYPVTDYVRSYQRTFHLLLTSIIISGKDSLGTILRVNLRLKRAGSCSNRHDSTVLDRYKISLIEMRSTFVTKALL